MTGKPRGLRRTGEGRGMIRKAEDKNGERGRKGGIGGKRGRGVHEEGMG